MEKRVKRIKVISAPLSAWYHFCIGNCFDVIEDKTKRGDVYWVKIGEKNYGILKSDVVVIEWHEQSYAERQAEWVRDNNLKVGDKVKVVREWVLGENSTVVNPVENESDIAIGKVFRVSRINGDISIALYGSCCYPYFVLELVKDEYRVFTQAEALRNLLCEELIDENGEIVTVSTIRCNEDGSWYADLDNGRMISPKTTLKFKYLYGTPVGVQI